LYRFALSFFENDRSTEKLTTGRMPQIQFLKSRIPDLSGIKVGSNINSNIATEITIIVTTGKWFDAEG